MGSSNPGVQTIIHMIPSQHIGSIIGRGGDSIKSLQSRTGARVQVDKNMDGAVERALTITGSPQQIDQVKQEVAQIIAAKEQGGGYGGGGGGYGGGGQGGYGGGAPRGGQGGYQQGGGYGGGQSRGVCVWDGSHPHIVSGVEGSVHFTSIF
jgi:far upstream element-binding protein